MLSGLVTHPEQPEAGYEAFFRKYPQWQVEHRPLDETQAWKTLATKLPTDLLSGKRLSRTLFEVVGTELPAQVEGRLLYTVNKDHLERHGGVLRTPSDLAHHVPYTRPEIVRHFGEQYDPTRHNLGILWFGEQHGVIITKLDTSGAKKTHRYQNHFLSERRFSWTSQNKMARANNAGRRVLEHGRNGVALHLFVQRRSHAPAFYMGEVQVAGVRGDEPMTVTFELERPVPRDLQRELGGITP